MFRYYKGGRGRLIKCYLGEIRKDYMHPQVIGRGHRLALLERFMRHVLSGGRARFARMGDVARELSDEQDP